MADGDDAPLPFFATSGGGEDAAPPAAAAAAAAPASPAPAATATATVDYDSMTMEEEVEELVREELGKTSKMSNLRNENGVDYAPWMGIYGSCLFWLLSLVSLSFCLLVF